VIQVRVLSFGVLKERFGSAAATLELPDGATVGSLLEHLAARRSAAPLRGIAVSVNAEYAVASQELKDGDEVGLLPPVSGGSVSGGSGSGASSDTATETQDDSENVLDENTHTFLTREAIDAERLAIAAKRGEDGAVVVFDGIVRNNTRGRQTLYLDYEAYEEMAAKQMRELAAEARTRFGVRHVTIVHRLGRLMVGQTSVLVVVASAHRGHAYEASRWLIDTLKKTVPIWKRETFADGVVWADGEPFPAELAVERATEPEAVK
jgi:molybdopterin synthase catalytic subunit